MMIAATTSPDTRAAAALRQDISARDRRKHAVSALFGTLLRRIDRTLIPPGALPRSGIHSILVCRPNHRLGNTVLVSPLLSQLESVYPGAEIDLVSAGDAATALYATRFHVRRVLALPRHATRHPVHTVNLLRGMRAHRYDLAIDAGLDSNSGRLLLGASQARYKLGFPGPDAASPMHAYRDAMPAHHGKRCIHLLRVALGQALPAAAWPKLNVQLTLPELTRAGGVLEQILADAGRRLERAPVIGLFANATADKQLPQAWWDALIDRLHRQRPDLHIINILAHHGVEQASGVHGSFYSRDLRKLGAFLANLDAFVSGDCGVMHLAAAVGCPTFALFTRDNSDKYAPCDASSRSVVIDSEHTAGACAEQLDAWLSRRFEPARVQAQASRS